ncbi:hypothetical protein [Atopobium sp. oral taxon 810]|uniref:hypothetical protein n=1 Tax=Atopobium sp. oral taxon 810 TaxID=712158 RepID=UPI0003966B91|nr:hypothetical protein [Atopobium sp. oral taxon 810]ERI04232.1 hypothetical protein HMPREF9069_01623 [Atopobium sp. oral taxon 810 str. F0209]
MGVYEAFSGERGIGNTPYYEVAGKHVVCSHCGRDKFDKRTAQLNTAAATFFGLDWANVSATVLVCQNCGHLEWFLEE